MEKKRLVYQRMDFRGRTERAQTQVGFDGYPSRYQLGTRMVVRETSGRICVNLGGIAGV